MNDNPSKLSLSGKLKAASLFRSHWKGLTIALIAVLGETLADVLEPWPIKVIVDNILQAKKLPKWLDGIVSGLFGHDKLAILTFAVAAVAAIAVLGAVSSYIEQYMTTECEPMGGARPAPHSLQPHPTAFACGTRCGTHRRLDIAGNRRYRCRAKLYQLRTPGHSGRYFDSGRHDRRHALRQLEVHANRALGCARTVWSSVLPDPPDQAGLSRRSQERKRADLDRGRGTDLRPRGESLRSGRLRSAKI